MEMIYWAVLITVLLCWLIAGIVCACIIKKIEKENEDIVNRKVEEALYWKLQPERAKLQAARNSYGMFQRLSEKQAQEIHDLKLRLDYATNERLRLAKFLNEKKQPCLAMGQYCQKCKHGIDTKDIVYCSKLIGCTEFIEEK